MLVALSLVLGRAAEPEGCSCDDEDEAKARSCLAAAEDDDDGSAMARKSWSDGRAAEFGRVRRKRRNGMESCAPKSGQSELFFFFFFL